MKLKRLSLCTVFLIKFKRIFLFESRVILVPMVLIYKNTFKINQI